MELEPREIVISVQLPSKECGHGLLDVTCPTSCKGKGFGEFPPKNCGLTTLDQEKIYVVTFKELEKYREVVTQKERLYQGNCIPLTREWEENAGKKFGKYSS